MKKPGFVYLGVKYITYTFNHPTKAHLAGRACAPCVPEALEDPWTTSTSRQGPKLPAGRWLLPFGAAHSQSQT